MKDKKQQVIRYSDKEQQRVKRHIEKHFGPILGIMKELISPDICVDIYVVAPTEGKQYYTYVTAGMGAYKMNTDGIVMGEKIERSELIMTIPLGWDISTNENKFYWPAKFMKQAARFPITTGKPLAARYTISNNGKAFDSSTEMSSVLVSLPLNFDKKSTVCKVGFKKKIHFFQLIPIYKEELAAIKKQGFGSFLAKMGPELLKPLNPVREKFYKKRTSSKSR